MLLFCEAGAAIGGERRGEDALEEEIIVEGYSGDNALVYLLSGRESGECEICCCCEEMEEF